MEILVVDDDRSVLQLLTEILTHTGHHKITTAGSVRSALERIAAADRPFDCLLVDIQMPETDGIALVRLIRETPGYSDSPVLMLTAMDEKSYLDRAFAAGATDYVTKPFDLMELRTRIVEAQRLVHERALAAEQPLMAGQFREAGDGTKTFTLAQPIPLKDRNTALGYREFENYVLELTRTCNVDAAFRAVKIADVERHYRQNSSGDFAHQVETAARTIRDVLTSERGAFSYRGNGAFICLCDPPVTTRSALIEDALTQRIDRVSGEGDMPSFRMVVGDPVQLKSGTDSTVLEQMSAALESVEQKSFAMRDVISMTRRFISRRRVTDDQRRLEQKAYETLLKKMLRDPEDDTWNRKLQEREGRLSRST